MPMWTTDDAVSCHSRRSLIETFRRAGFDVQRMTSHEPGKQMPDIARHALYRVTEGLARMTRDRIAWTPGLVCMATRRRAESPAG
jgi:hypothetical protein